MGVWLFGGRTTTATRAAWELAHGFVPPDDLVVCRTCDSHDCVNPAHLKLMSRTKAVKLQFERGRFDPAKLVLNAKRASRKQAKLTDELRTWLYESPQNGVEVAHALGISQGRANGLRAQARKSVAFEQLLKVAA